MAIFGGGVTSLSGIQNLKTKQAGSRIGGTAAWRFSKHQSLKASYSAGTYSRFGGNYQNVAVAWQYSWLGWPKKSSGLGTVALGAASRTGVP